MSNKKKNDKCITFNLKTFVLRQLMLTERKVINGKKIFRIYKYDKEPAYIERMHIALSKFNSKNNLNRKQSNNKMIYTW